MHSVIPDRGNWFTRNPRGIKFLPRLLFHKQEAQTSMALRRIRIGPRQNGKHMGAVGERTPRLGPRDQIAVAVPPGPGLNRSGVRTRIRLGKCSGRKNLPGGYPR